MTHPMTPLPTPAQGAFTKGPWRLDRGALVDASGQRVVCYSGPALRIGGPNATLSANDALIAAAPDLYEACHQAMTELRDMAHSSGDPDAPDNMEAVAVVYRLCRAALAKATGSEGGR